MRRALPRQRRAALGFRCGRPRRAAQRGHDLRDAGRGPGDVRLVGAEPAAAVRGGGGWRLGGGAAVRVRPDLRRVVDPGAALGRLGDGAAVSRAVCGAPARHSLALSDSGRPIFGEQRGESGVADIVQAITRHLEVVRAGRDAQAVHHPVHEVEQAAHRDRVVQGAVVPAGREDRPGVPRGDLGGGPGELGQVTEQGLHAVADRGGVQVGDGRRQDVGRDAERGGRGRVDAVAVVAVVQAGDEGGDQLAFGRGEGRRGPHHLFVQG